jgi:hypothetical protein
MELDRLYEVINLSSVVQIVHDDKLVRVESVNESDNGDIAQVLYAESGHHAYVPVDELKEASLGKSSDEYITDWMTRSSPIIRS